MEKGLELSTDEMFKLGKIAKSEIAALKALNEFLKTAIESGAVSSDYLSERLNDIVTLAENIETFVRKYHVNVTHNLWRGKYSEFMPLLDELTQYTCETDLKQITITPESLVGVNTFIKALAIAQKLLPNDEIKALETALIDRRTDFTRTLADSDNANPPAGIHEVQSTEVNEEGEEEFYEDAMGEEDEESYKDAMGEEVEDEESYKDAMGEEVEEDEKKKQFIITFNAIIQKFQAKLNKLEIQKNRLGATQDKTKHQSAIDAGNTLIKDLNIERDRFKNTSSDSTTAFLQLKEGIKTTFSKFEAEEKKLQAPRPTQWLDGLTKLKNKFCKKFNISFKTNTTKKFASMKKALTDLKEPSSQEELKDSPKPR